MDDRRPFLDAIRQEPDDPVPRLVYADWLDENGEATRAALIRYQMAAGGSIELARPRRDELGLPPILGPGPVRFKGGFLTGSVVTTPVQLAALGPLAGEEPILDLTCDDYAPDFDLWAECGPIRDAVTLGVHQHALRRGGFASVAPHLTCRRLAFVSQSGADPSGPLRRFGPLARLDALTFSRVPLSGSFVPSAIALAGRLRSLSADCLLEVPSHLEWPDLERLVLTQTEAVRDLVRRADFPRLRDFSIESDTLEAWPDRIASLGWAAGLERLSLTGRGESFDADAPNRSAAPAPS